MIKNSVEISQKSNQLQQVNSLLSTFYKEYE